VVTDADRGYGDRVTRNLVGAAVGHRGATTVRRRALAAALLVPSIAFAHVRLIAPAPRTTTILKTPPCGGIARTASDTVLTAGDLIDVSWVETIDHPGHYELAVSPADDQGFVTLLGDIPDRSFAPGATERVYTMPLRVPSRPCDACTLQLIQFMSDHPPGSQYYYSCADIRIVASATSTTAPSGATSTTTLPSPPAACDGLAAYDRATCLITDATARAMCGSDGLDAHLEHVLDVGLATVQRLLDGAVTFETSSKRARHRLATARRRLAMLRRRVAAGRDRGRVDATCAETIVARLDDVRAAVETLASPD
jgi:hypothetical protein